MYKRYFRKKDPNCKASEIEWIEMTGREFYQFVNSPEGRGRYFIDMDDVVLEGTRSLARSYRSEKNHNDYLKRQGEGRTILSIYAVGNKYGYCGEEIAKDETQDVEAQVIAQMELCALQTALSQLDPSSYQLIYSLFISNKRKTEQKLAKELGVSQNSINKQKKKILKRLKFLVVKNQKSQ